MPNERRKYIFETDVWIVSYHQWRLGGGEVTKRLRHARQTFICRALYPGFVKISYVRISLWCYKGRIRRQASSFLLTILSIVFLFSVNCTLLLPNSRSYLVCLWHVDKTKKIIWFGTEKCSFLLCSSISSTLTLYYQFYIVFAIHALHVTVSVYNLVWA